MPRNKPTAQQEQRTTTTGAGKGAQQRVANGAPPMVNGVAPANDAQKGGATNKDLAGVIEQESVLLLAQSDFNRNVEDAEGHIKRVFSAMRDALNAREAESLSELKSVKAQAAAFFNDRYERSKALRVNIEKSASFNGKQMDALRSDLKHFVDERKLVMNVASERRFVCTEESAIQSLKGFGSVTPFLPASTMVSTPVQAPAVVNGFAKGHVEETAPMNTTFDVDDKKGCLMGKSALPIYLLEQPIAELTPPTQAVPVVKQRVEQGGIVMESESMSADEISKVMQQAQDLLKSQGISEDVVAAISPGAPPMRSLRTRKAPSAATTNGTSEKVERGGAAEKPRGRGKPTKKQ